MIKIGIVGADSADAGELIRILINHPESDLITLFSPRMNGRSVSSVHTGLIGENIVNFTDKIDPSALDVVFLTDNSDVSEQIKNNRDKWPELKIIDFSPSRRYITDGGFAFGLSEINRKELVRGSIHSVIPSAAHVSVALIALAPLAKFLLLTPSIKIDGIIGGIDDCTNEKGRLIESEIEVKLKEIQNSFNGKIILSQQSIKEEPRLLRQTMELDCQLSLDEISKIYEEIYDDHNFTFITHSPVGTNEVEGTQKVILTLDKPTPDKLIIQAVGDSKMRGGAGDAVHVMNLLFGLYEKTGLQLKSHSYGLKQEQDSASSTWFA